MLVRGDSMNPMKDTVDFQKISDVTASIAWVCFIVSVGVGHSTWSRFFLLVILLDVAINIYIYREQMSHLRLVVVSSIISLLFLVGVVLSYYRLMLVSVIAFWIIVLVLRVTKKLPLGIRHLIRTHHLISGHNSNRI
jgi:uncharacterized membrane protein (DUF373 family)